MATIPPRRGEVFTPDGQPTRRFMEYLESLTRQANESESSIGDVASDDSTRAQLASLHEKVGSGDPLTWDETGFTWDSTKHSFDQTES